MQKDIRHECQQEKNSKMRKCNLGRVVKEDEKCDTEFLRRIGIAKVSFQYLRRIMNSECSGSECFNVSSQMKTRYYATETCFYRKMNFVYRICKKRGKWKGKGRLQLQ